MEDAHSFVADFAGVRGQGYFAVFDGHAGKHAAEWCGEHFHEELIQALYAASEDSENAPPTSKKSIVPDVLNTTFHAVDDALSRMADEGQTHSGCTAVTAFLRLEDDDGNQPRIYVDAAQAYQQTAAPNPLGASSSLAANNTSDETVGSTGSSPSKSSRFNAKVKNAVRSITGKSPTSEPEDLPPVPPSSSTAPVVPTPVTSAFSKVGSRASISTMASAHPVTIFPHATRRVLYTANAGDARAVLSRGGKAVRLTYDHKGSDVQEARRIKEAGGFVMNNRVNGMCVIMKL